MNTELFIGMAYDSHGYEAYADHILSNSNWLHHADLNAFLDSTIFRMPFYPLLIAANKYLFGPAYWKVFVCIFQVLLLVVSATSINSVCKKLNFSNIQKAFVLIGYLTGHPLLFSFYILTDSLYTSLGVICLCSLTKCLLNEKNRTDCFIVASCLFVLALLRETTFYYALTCLPFACYFLLKLKFIKFIKFILILLLPVYLAVVPIKCWNFHRTQTYILTTGLATALITPQIEFINNYPQHSQSLSLTAYLPSQQNLMHEDGVLVVKRWIDNKEFDFIQITKKFKLDLYRMLFFYPRESLKNALIRTPLDIFFVELNPFFTIQEFIESILGYKLLHISSVISNFKNLNDYPIWELLQVGLVNIFRIFSIAICLLGFFKVGQRIRYFQHDSRNYIYIALFTQAILWIATYTLVHIEVRYVMSSIVIFTLLGFSPKIQRKQNV
jgi:hypothetical protein